MKPTKKLKIVLWSVAVFMELSSLACFYGGKWPVVKELFQGKHLLFSIEFLILALLFTVAALAKKLSKRFLLFLGFLCVLFFVLCSVLLLSQQWSLLAREILLLEALGTLLAAVFLGTQAKHTASLQPKAYIS